jgi:endoglucanase
VIYEIANEPNNGVNWLGSIRPYAQEVIREIRAIDPYNLVIVGTGTWSQDIHEVIGNTINERNVMYVVHFYAGSHGRSLRDRISAALANKVGVFISECGVSNANGHSGVYWNQMREWVDFLNQQGISWVVWSWSDKNESSALILPGQSQQGANPGLSEAGRLIQEVIRKK